MNNDWVLLSPVAGRPGRPMPDRLRQQGPVPAAPCRLALEEIPAAWLSSFPTGAQIVAKSVELRPERERNPDDRLLRRRDCEYEIFLSVEEAVEMPRIREGFANIEEFVSRAQSILQRRKSRAGRSLELQAKEILLEERLRETHQFAHGVESEPGRKPDFLFPSQECYRDAAFPPDRLRMLAVKTTCRDRWRQILNEARRIETKHLLTVQEGVSEGTVPRDERVWRAVGRAVAPLDPLPGGGSRRTDVAGVLHRGNPAAPRLNGGSPSGLRHPR